MMIVCPNCATSYQVDESTLGGAGRSVRCVRCHNIWFAHDPGALSAIAQAHRSDVETFAGTVHDAAPDDHLLDDHPSAEAPAELVIDGEPVPDETIADADAEDPPEPTDELPEDDPLPHTQEPIEIADAPSLAPMEDSGELPADAALEGTLGKDPKPFAARRSPRRESKPFRWPLPGLPVTILTLVALNTALIGWRADVVRLVPQTASLYAALGLPVNLRGLTFGNVTTAIETQDGVQVLVVEGTIASASPRAVEVPRLRFSVRNHRGQEVYAWTALPARGALSPGETLAFRSRLASPPPDMREVLVRFFNRRDLVASVP
jgi:predicted Zn finger-like uncharacterized protein